jgi:hypothetical protein
MILDFLFGRHLEKNIFPFLSSRINELQYVQTNRHFAAHILLIFIKHQYLGATNHLALMYYCCKQTKKFDLDHFRQNVAKNM